MNTTGAAIQFQLKMGLTRLRSICWSTHVLFAIINGIMFLVLFLASFWIMVDDVFKNKFPGTN